MKKVMLPLLLVLNIVNGYGQAGIITTFAGNGTAAFSGDGGAATSASMSFPFGLAFDVSGNLYIADQSYRIRKVNTSGVISTVAGNPITGGLGDGGPATFARLDAPSGIAIDGIGNIYIADYFENRIRKIDTSGIISTFAGSGSAGFSGDGSAATAADLNKPFGVAIDGSGNLYIADRDNNRIRKVTTSGVISTFAGNGSAAYSGDGGAAIAASLNDPASLALDVSGNLYVADRNNNRIRKINTSGVISTIAGNGSAGFSGDGGSATAANLSYPFGLTFDVRGNLYMADVGNSRIRKMDTSGVISTIAGNGSVGFSGDGGAATASRMAGPYGIAIDGIGNLYIADANNHRVRRVGLPFLSISSTTPNSGAEKLNVYPNPSGGLITIELPGYTGLLDISIVDVNGKVVLRRSGANNKVELSLRSQPKGIYSVQVVADGKQFSSKIVVE